MKSCPKCMQENDLAANFCILCRSPFNAGGALTCPKGHVLDPTWTECVYCAMDRTGDKAPAASVMIPPANRPKTVVENATPMPDRSATAQMPAFSEKPQPPAAGAGRRGHTMYVAPPDPSAEGAAPRQQERKILGILITYSWKPEGQIFPVREGRNLIGRGAECEILVPEDTTLSSVNTHITFRKSFTIGDMVSMSGTDLNGEPIEEQFVPLSNLSRIRTGSTHWVFVEIPALSPTASAPSKAE